MLEKFISHGTLPEESLVIDVHVKNGLIWGACGPADQKKKQEPEWGIQ